MELITQAIAMALGRLDEKEINNAYTSLKETLQNKYGSSSELSDAINDLEQTPNSKDCLDMLEEEIIMAGANTDKTLTKMAKSLIDTLKVDDVSTVVGFGNKGTVRADDYLGMRIK